MDQASLFCPEHGNFPTKDAFDKHILRHHSDAPVVQTITSSSNTPPAGVDPSLIPNDELTKMIQEASQAKNKPTPPPTPKQPIVSQPTTPKQVPIKLTYRYEGTCSTCGTDVTTLMLDMSTKNKKSLFAVSFCKVCNKKLGERKVTSI